LFAHFGAKLLLKLANLLLLLLGQGDGLLHIAHAAQASPGPGCALLLRQHRRRQEAPGHQD